MSGPNESSLPYTPPPNRCTCVAPPGGAPPVPCPACAAWGHRPRFGGRPSSDPTVPRCTKCRQPWEGPLRTCDACRVKINAREVIRRQRRRTARQRQAGSGREAAVTAVAPAAPLSIREALALRRAPINGPALDALQAQYEAYHADKIGTSGHPWPQEALVVMGRLYHAAWGTLPPWRHCKKHYSMPDMTSIRRHFTNLAAYHTAITEEIPHG